MATIKGPNGQIANVTDTGRLDVAAVVTDFAETVNTGERLFCDRFGNANSRK